MAETRTMRGRGFTLVEMMVTLIIIALIVASILPSAVALFKAGADSQAKNLLSSQLAAARALAMYSDTYAGVHVQMADNPGKFYKNAAGKCYMAVVKYNPTAGAPGPAAGTFSLADGYSPVKVPGTYAFGEVSPVHVNGATYQQLSDGTNQNDFRSFTIVFSPTGEVVIYVNQKLIVFDQTPGIGSLFRPYPDPQSATELSCLWDVKTANSTVNGDTGKAGVSAVVLFDYALLDEIASDPDRSAFLKSRGLLLPVNVYTGQLFETE